MARREGFWFFAVACLLFFALSGLVESPVTEESVSLPRWDAAMIEAVRSYPPAVPESIASCPAVSKALRLSLWIAITGLLAALSCAFCRDANGRWIQKKRYASSVYQVFRPEVAGG